MISVTLPYPPSANRLWRNVNGRTLTSAAYKAWQKEAVMLVRLAARAKQIDGPYAMTIRVGKPDNRRRDLGNLLKATEDALVAGQAVRDDSDAQMIELAWATGIVGLHVLVRPVETVAEAAARRIA